VAADHDAVHLVELAGHTTGLLAERVAAAVGVREESGLPILHTLARHLGGRVLLLLDNCEHVRADAAALVHDLLAACPGVRILATSREPLGLAGEIIFPLAGLATSGPGEQEARSDAVRLLADRVAAARGGIALRPAELPRAAELCRRLDGLPLALELAAARLRALPLAEVMSRLDRRLDLLIGKRSWRSRRVSWTLSRGRLSSLSWATPRSPASPCWRSPNGNAPHSARRSSPRTR
jgi:predicted ATPase